MSTSYRVVLALGIRLDESDLYDMVLQDQCDHKTDGCRFCPTCGEKVSKVTKVLRKSSRKEIFDLLDKDEGERRGEVSLWELDDEDHSKGLILGVTVGVSRPDYEMDPIEINPNTELRSDKLQSLLKSSGLADRTPVLFMIPRCS